MQEWFFLAEDMDEPRALVLGAGTVHLLTTSSPEKETPNEDSVAVFELDDGAVVLAVADGAGGHRSGDRASAAALRALGRELARDTSADERVRTAVLNGIEAAHQAVVALGIGAATTLAVAQIRDRRVRPYHAGDSPILLLGQRGRIKVAPTAHSPMGYAVEAGMLHEETALHHEERHVVSNLLGIEAMHIELGSEVALAPRDTLLLASDGLTDNVRTNEIVELARRGPAERAVERLVRAARERMRASDTAHPSKPDDLTVVLYRPASRTSD